MSVVEVEVADAKQRRKRRQQRISEAESGTEVETGIERETEVMMVIVSLGQKKCP
jgi:hypothetical protein